MKYLLQYEIPSPLLGSIGLYFSLENATFSKVQIVKPFFVFNDGNKIVL